MSTENNICRACLATKESFVYVIFENVSPDIYYFCTSVEVHQDNLPRTLCNSCYEYITKYSEFKRTCIQSQKTLLQLCLTEEIQINADFKIKDELNDNTEVKTEIPSEFDGDNFPLKSEDVCDDYGNDCFVTLDLQTNTIKTRKKKNKSKVKKVKKQNGEASIKIIRRHFNFTCGVCNKKFIYEERFEAHKLEHEGKESSISCLACKKTFTTWSGLWRHNESEHTLVSLEKIKCNICGKICKTRQTLQMHKKIHGERKMYVCDVCGKGFTTKFILKDHLDTHKENRERLFTCEHCGKKFYTNTILLSHISRRHTSRRFICQICSYPFTDKHNLAKHLLIHDGKKLFKCEICNKTYASRSSLVEHKRIHSGERPYICSYCPKNFLSKRRLNDHHKIHTGERPHKCAICEQSFTQRGTLKRHMKVHERYILS